MAGVLTSEQKDVVAASHGGSGHVDQKTLIRALMRLKWTLWKRSYRKNVGKIIGAVIGGLYAVGGLFGLVMAMIGATVWSVEGGSMPLIVMGLGAAATLLWLLLPALAFGLDDTLDARLFATFPRTAKELQPGLFLSSLISGSALATFVAILIVTGFEVLWLVLFWPGTAWGLLTLLALLPANVAGFAICLLLPRAWFAHSATRASSRKGRELGGILSLLLLMAVIYGFSLIGQSMDGTLLEQLSDILPIAITVLAWTPFGAAFAIPMDLAAGALLAAIARTLITAATIVLLVLWWRRSLHAAMTSALIGDASSGTQKVTALVPRWMPSNALGASVGRSLRYWRRDTRYYAALGILPVVIIFLGALGVVVPEQRIMSTAMIVFMLGVSSISLANEIGFDGPAGWVNISTGMKARPNLLGRVIALAVIMLPFILIIGIGLPLLYGWPHVVPLVVSGALGMTLSGWGVSMIVCVFLPYPSSAPGTNPMKDKSASNANALLAMAIASFGVFVPQLPAIGLAVWGIITANQVVMIVAGAVSVLGGLVMLLIGLKIGSARLERAYPDLFQKVSAFV